MSEMIGRPLAVVTGAVHLATQARMTEPGSGQPGSGQPDRGQPDPDQ